MTATLTVRDEALDGRAPHEWPLDVPAERMTVRELIRSRVDQEARDRRGHRLHGRPDLLRAAPAGRRPAAFDGDRRYEVVARAFEAGQVLILVGDAQATRLDEEFAVGPGTAVTFVRLSVLAGG